jgi:acyl transferase domain-containing protein
MMLDNLNSEVRDSDIAIIGMSVNVPGAKNIDEFWQNLKNGVESIQFFSTEEVLASGVKPELAHHPNYVKAKAVVDDIDKFDAEFFGIHPREAEISDPQHRLFLECASSALEISGYDSQSYDGLIGVYASSGISRYYLQNIYGNSELLNFFDDFQLYLANDSEFLATRTAYRLNLKGPAINIQTACSSSLVAVHLACQGLLSGECDIALAGGVTLKVNPEIGYLYQEGMIHSPDGHCRAFDAQAKGTVGSGGVAIVALKRATEAIADGDYIYALIKGSAINNDGAVKVGYTAPSIEGQVNAIQSAQSVADVAAETITYIEAHGTGTQLGDPIEIAALTQAFRDSTDQTQFCAIASLKTNVGHLNSAAGVAGLIKTALAIKHQQIPPSLHFEHPNPNIDFANSPFYVNTKLSHWESKQAPRRAGVSSFGIGGTNAHIILEEAPTINNPNREQKYPEQLLILSAKTPAALEQATENLGHHLQQHPDLNLGDIAYTLTVGRKAFEHRRIVVAANLEETTNHLLSKSSSLVTGKAKKSIPSAIFMFSGQGSQYVNMARGLYEQENVFRETVDRCAELLFSDLKLDLRSLIYPETDQQEKAEQQLQQTAIAQPALFTIEYALAQLWESWGIQPAGFIGHSVGEYVAACLAGVFSLEDALSLVATRGKMIQQLPPGAILSIPLAPEKFQPFLNESVAIAAINEPSRCVVSGTIEAISALENQLKAQGIETRPLKTSHAFHSPMMEPILDAFSRRVAKVKLSSPQIPLVSNVTGNWMTPTQATDPKYWSQHVRSLVNFARGIECFLDNPDQILLEVKPGRTLSTFVKRHPLFKATQVVLNSVRHPQETDSDIRFVLKTLGQLWVNGVAVNWDCVYQEQSCDRIPLPTYPFQRQRYWVEPNKTTQTTQNTQSTNLVIDSDFSSNSKHEMTPQNSQSLIYPTPNLMTDLKETFAEISGLNHEAFDESATFLEMGFDSLTLAQIAQALEKRFKVKLTFRQLIQEFYTLKLLSEYLSANLPPELVKPIQTNPIQTNPIPSHPVPIKTPPVSPSNQPDIQSIITQQLQVMSEQLTVLRQWDNSVISPPTATELLNQKEAQNSQTVNNSTTNGWDSNRNSQSETSPNYKPLTVGAKIQKKPKQALTPTQQNYLQQLIERYTTKTTKSKAYTQANRFHFADPRTVSGFNPTLKEMVYPIVTTRSAGAKLWDIDGNEYIDLINGFGSNFLGHSSPLIIVGGGMPIGVIAGKSRFMDALDGGFWQYGDESVPEVGVTFLAGTFVRHLLAMAAAKAILSYFKQKGDELHTQLNQKSHQMVTTLNNYFETISQWC